MKTIGRHWPSTALRGDYIAMCGHCGARWRRSQLRVDGAGVLTCPMEGRGPDAATLLKEEATEARTRRSR